MASDTLPPTDAAAMKKTGRVKVHLKPGFHLVDWMNLMRVSTDMSGRNGGPLRKISLSELKQHTSQFDCWTAYNGKVYNISQYMHYHPGGIPMLMKGAGKDSTKLFNKYHAWVNLDNMLGKCLVGVLIADEPGIAEDEEGEDEDVEEGDKKASTPTPTRGEAKLTASLEEMTAIADDKDVDEMRRRAKAALSIVDEDDDIDEQKK